ncbi:MAG: hypothetical protein QW589_01265 [Candidatus Bathyarchaeia archaeon]
MSWEAFLSRRYVKLRTLRIELKALNTIKLQASEDFRHALAKFLVCYGIFNNNHHFKTEQKINNAVCDVIDLDNFIIYEIESDAGMTKQKKKLEDFYHPYIEDIIIVDLKKIEGWEAIDRLFNSVCLHYGISKHR